MKPDAPVTSTFMAMEWLSGGSASAPELPSCRKRARVYTGVFGASTSRLGAGPTACAPCLESGGP